MKRTDERKKIIELLFQHDFNELKIENFDELFENTGTKKTDFIESSLISIVKNLSTIDDLIKNNLTYKNFNTILSIEKTILRISINEFYIQKSVPVQVSINEAVENSKIYGNDDSYKLVNGVLSSIAKAL